ncbi:MAG: MFS transporter [Candidatus Omnitrophota bacterium]
MFSSLKVRNFRIYWVGMFISLVGTWIQIVAQSWLVFELTHSAFLLGVVGFLSTIPVFLLSLFGGVLADRMNKRNILIATQTAFMMLAFLLAVLTQRRVITAAQIMIIAVLNGAVMAFDAPSRQAVVIELVGKQNLFNAVALSSAAFNSSRIIGPVLAALLVASIGMSGCFYINGISFLAFIFALFLIQLNNNAKMNGKNNKAWQDLKEGLSFIKNNRLILLLLAMVAIVSLFGISYVILMPIFADEVLKVGIQGMGLLMSSAGIGALIGALSLARLGDFPQKGRYLILCCMFFSVSLVLLSLSKIYVLSMAALAGVGWSSVSAVALINTLLQTNVPDMFRGRVMSLFMLTFAGMMPFGNLIAGSLAHGVGVSMALMTSGIICAVLFVIINIACPDIKNI